MNIVKTRNRLTFLIVVVAVFATFVVAAISRSGIVSAQEIEKNLECGASIQFSNPQEGCRVSNAGVDASERVDQIVTQIINIMSLAVGVVAVIMIIVGGFRYITSGGESGSVTGAKNTILYAVVGLVVVALSQVIVRFVIERATLNDSSAATD